MLRQSGKLILAPLFLISVVIGTALTFIVIAIVSVGSWFEVLLRRLGYRVAEGWLPGILGVAAYLLLGIIGLGLLGKSAIGWPGLLIGPIGGLILVALIDRW